MRRNFAYVALAVLVIVSAAFSYGVYRDRPRQSDADIRVDESGISSSSP